MHRTALKGFSKVFGVGATAIVRAPGRVNLIGEHIDYCGLPVLPMAIRSAVWLAFRPAEGRTVRVATDIDGLEPCTFEASGSIHPGPAGDWGNYVRAAVQAIGPPCGFDAFVTSDLPVASGLSSSSALVVATALASIAASGRGQPAPLALAGELAEAERYVGTAGGGMDQAACLLGRAGHALRIDFDPLRVEPVAFPAGWRLVVGHSGEPAAKSGDAQSLYNLRTRESASAAVSVAATLGVAAPPAGYPALLARHTVTELLDAARRALEEPLCRRFRHVVSESERVLGAIEAIRSGDLSRTGGLLNASHRSLKCDYEVSTPALDTLVGAALHAGAAGARLTGAGLGGCAIALCEESSLDAVFGAVQAFEAARPGPRIALVAEPSDGARVWSDSGADISE